MTGLTNLAIIVVVVLQILFVAVWSKQIPQNEVQLIKTEQEICGKVCSKNFQCNWSTWHNRLQYIFPDETVQTCIGAQVRCGCTFSMRLISYISYEHPTAVVLCFLFITTVAAVLLLTHIAHKGCLFMFSRTSPQQSPKPFTSNMDLYGEHWNHGIIISTTPDFSSLSKGDEAPPSYNTLELSADEPPPYATCIKSNVGKSAVTDAV